MDELERARRIMVDSQVRTADVTDRRLQQALRTIPRELFAPQGTGALAYADIELQVAPGRSLMRPRDLAKLVQELAPQPGERALEIAGATGYGAAVLAALGCNVVCLEPDPEVAPLARKALQASGFSSVVLGVTDARSGWPDGAPYDVILLNGAAEEVPAAWPEQLAEGGRMGVIVRNGPAGSARIYRRDGGVTAFHVAFDAAPPVAPGLQKPPAFVF